MNTEKYVSINQYTGGFVVLLGPETFVVTSLNKAIKLVRDYLSAGDEPEAD
jgi:hypothetical protein